MYRKNEWKEYSDEQMKAVMDFSEGYKDFITKGKTERICVDLTVEMAEAKGFRNIVDVIAAGDKLKAGDKVYVTNMNKNAALFVIGEKPM